MRIIAADSGGALLNESFEPTHVVCTVAVLVEPPYKSPSAILAEPTFCPVEDGYSVLVKELELCRKLLEVYEADIIHFDLSFRSARLDALNVSDLAHLPEKARLKLARILPKLKFLASELWASKGVPALAIGKDSIPVRIAELSCAAHSLLFSAEKAVEEGREIYLGLPTKCVVRYSSGFVIARSLIPGEHDILGLAEDRGGRLSSVEILDMPNPVARGFRVLMIKPSARTS